MEDKTMVTYRQNEYLLQLSDGPKTTNELVLSMMITAASAGKIIARLRDHGLVQSEKIRGVRGNVYLHSLTTPYDKMNLMITNGHSQNPIRKEEIFYAAILRNHGLIGQRLTDQFQKVFPGRDTKSITKHVVLKARRAKLCL